MSTNKPIIGLVGFKSAFLFLRKSFKTSFYAKLQPKCVMMWFIYSWV